ncbi:LysE family transporter [Planobispora rosea]|uniref:LysE family transporter n=1 Tax=Planobispora rosea TaxID=35762 RepID=UPI00083A839A|nr:LysE family transporter [Planobispora rosea]
MRRFGVQPRTPLPARAAPSSQDRIALLVYCLPPGPVSTEALRLGIRSGARHAWNLLLGSLVGDAVWAVAAVTTGSLSLTAVPFRVVLGLAGIVFLAALAWSAARSALRPEIVSVIEIPPGRALRTGVLLSLATPLALPFWLGVSAQVPAGEAAVFVTGFLAGALVYAVAWIGLSVTGGRLLGPRALRAVNAVAAAELGYFAVRLTLDTLGLLT